MAFSMSLGLTSPCFYIRGGHTKKSNISTMVYNYKLELNPELYLNTISAAISVPSVAPPPSLSLLFFIMRTLVLDLSLITRQFISGSILCIY